MNRWEAAEADGNRYYGAEGTIHQTGHLDVVVDGDGNVAEVWFRCQQLPFRQTPGYAFPRNLITRQPNVEIVGVELRNTAEEKL